VLELSSYQIDLTQSLDCDVAVLLNITPDHLDRYDSFEAYAASKKRLFEMQTTQHQAVIVNTGKEAGALYDRLRNHRGDVVFLTDGGPYAEPDFGPWMGEDRFDQKDWPALQGPHNADNASAAIAAVAAIGIDDDKIESGLRTYPGLPHRMERIRERDGILFVNDSKATNAEAAAPALAAYPKVRWIVGGRAKGETLGDTAAQLSHVVAAYTIGEAGPMFARLLRDAGAEVIECETLENAVKRAAEDSQAGETVLLSPASASFDQFRDFEARGDRFRELVGAL
jgi:UDP-N-acetylmuramoylalanine--D-glutamate ligase